MPTAGAPPNSWCCVRDLSPELVVYMRGTPQGRPLPTAVRAEGIPGAPQAEAKVLQVRIVTEKDGAGWGRGFLELWKSVILCVCVFFLDVGVRHNLLDFLGWSLFLTFCRDIVQ